MEPITYAGLNRGSRGDSDRDRDRDITNERKMWLRHGDLGMLTGTEAAVATATQADTEASTET